MIQVNGLHWPDDVKPSAIPHALEHVKGLDASLRLCLAKKRTRTAVQAGGNVGLWPRRMAQVFSRVITFEPDDKSRECLLWNVPDSVMVMDEALGDAPGRCSVAHRSLGSHRVTDGDDIAVTTIDALALDDLDLLQLDIEGYEGVALRGASATIARCKPIIHLELRDGFGDRYGCSVADVREWLKNRGYRQVASAPGSDFIFEAGQ